jgi:hypothetical protein
MSEFPPESGIDPDDHPSVTVTIEHEMPLPRGISEEAGLEAVREEFSGEIVEAGDSDRLSIDFEFNPAPNDSE